MPNYTGKNNAIAAAVAGTLKDRDSSVPILMVRTLTTNTSPFYSAPAYALQRKVEKLNAQIEKENQLKNLTSLNLSAAVGSSNKSLATEKVCLTAIRTYVVCVHKNCHCLLSCSCMHAACGML